MRVRYLILKEKKLVSDTEWRTDGMQPRHVPVYKQTRPTPRGWKWRSARADAVNDNDDDSFVLVARCSPERDNWSAWLLYVTTTRPLSASLVARFEHHGSHPGLHAHSDCERSGFEEGPSSIDKLTRYPDPGNERRHIVWDERRFWEAAKRFFRISDPKGSLL